MQMLITTLAVIAVLLFGGAIGLLCITALPVAVGETWLRGVL
jgi:hypothetical protein